MRCRYASLHQLGVFPYGGEETITGSLNNICNVGVPYGCKWNAYEPLLEGRAIPFLREFEPDLLIVSAGYDALASDTLADVLIYLPIYYYCDTIHFIIIIAIHLVVRTVDKSDSLRL